jgi:hypothetical protein
MDAFLILSSLGIVFYLVLLFALYRDGRKRPMRGRSVRKITVGTVPELFMTPGGGGFMARKRSSREEVLWVPLAKHHWKAAPRAIDGGRTKLVCIAPPADDNDDLQCG